MNPVRLVLTPHSMFSRPIEKFDRPSQKCSSKLGTKNEHCKNTQHDAYPEPRIAQNFKHQEDKKNKMPGAALAAALASAQSLDAIPLKPPKQSYTPRHTTAFDASTGDDKPMECFDRQNLVSLIDKMENKVVLMQDNLNALRERFCGKLENFFGAVCS